MLAEVLNLKGGTLEKKGPCPVCGGKDRFWIRPGKTQSVILGCRQGCGFSDIMRSFERLGLIDKEKLSPDQIKKRRLESKVSAQAYIWAMIVCSLYATDGTDSKEDLDTLEKAVKILKKAEKVGVNRLEQNWAWDHAEIREKGLIDGHR